MVDHSWERSESRGRRICVIAAVSVCHALAIWAWLHGSRIRSLSDTTASIEIRIIQAPRSPVERVAPPGPHLRRLGLSSIQLEVPSFDIPTPPSEGIQPEPPSANGGAGVSSGVNSGSGASGSGAGSSGAGNGTESVYSPLVFKSVPNQLPRPTPPTRGAVRLGDVEMNVCVDERGKVASVNIVRSSGSARLNARALDLTRRSRWKIAKLNGVPVFACSDFTVEFARN